MKEKTRVQNSSTQLSIKTLVEKCLRKLVRNYAKREEDFLTERDVVCALFCMLKEEMKKRNLRGLQVHSELRPYIKGTDTNRVIKQANGVVEWKEHKPRNSGAVVDAVIISTSQKYFDEAKENSQDVLEKYWRLVTYPLAAFVACVEVKIRVSGNINRIKSDIDKLRIIKDAKKNSLVYLVVVDHRAKADNKRIIEKYCLENGVPSYIAWLCESR